VGPGLTVSALSSHAEDRFLVQFLLHSTLPPTYRGCSSVSSFRFGGKTAIYTHIMALLTLPPNQKRGEPRGYIWVIINQAFRRAKQPRGLDVEEEQEQVHDGADSLWIESVRSGRQRVCVQHRTPLYARSTRRGDSIVGTGAGMNSPASGCCAKCIANRHRLSNNVSEGESQLLGLQESKHMVFVEAGKQVC
jgi:hypothetical protein